MTESFVLAIESSLREKGVVTIGIQGFLPDGCREVICKQRSFVVIDLIRALVTTPDVALIVSVLSRKGNTFRIDIDVSRQEAQAITDGIKRVLQQTLH